MPETPDAPEASAAAVRHEPQLHRFVVELASGEPAVLDYVLADRTITFTHTGVPAEHEGRGVGTQLVQAAMDHARAERLVVVPQCPFVLAWVKRHPDYQELVEPTWRGRLGGA